jgi:hypothetical protein
MIRAAAAAIRGSGIELNLSGADPRICGSFAVDEAVVHIWVETGAVRHHNGVTTNWLDLGVWTTLAVLSIRGAFDEGATLATGDVNCH